MKKILTAFGYGLFLFILLEFGIGQLGYRLTQGKWHSYEDAKKERNDIIAASSVSERTAANIDFNPKTEKKRRSEILHPYMGFVVDFHENACPGIGFCDDRIRSYQQRLQGDLFPEPAPDRAIVAITGGSFAYGVANNSTPGKLEQALAAIPALQGKEIFVYTLALGGYKQPQQLFTLQYFLAMGVHFDMVINIDGFNETVLPVVENLPFRTNPFFPRVWHGRVKAGAENYLEKELQGLKTYLSMQRSELAEKTNGDISRRSALRGLIWKLGDSNLERKIAEAETDFLEKAKAAGITKSRLVATGPKFVREDRLKDAARLADSWRKSSLMMAAVAKANGIAYYHFLQPNQYVADSKPMNEDERAVALLEGSKKTHPYAEPARIGYPQLISQGSLLSQSGVAFRDLTMMFKDNSEVLYRDACCHLNRKGYDYVIDDIANFIASSNAGKTQQQAQQ